jgi:hypothetical protein
MAREAPGGGDLPPEPVEVQQIKRGRPVRRKEPPKSFTLNMPFSLYEELKDFKNSTEIPINEILVDGARKELARLKKQYGLEE